MNAEFVVLIPTTVSIPYSAMISLIEKTEDVIAAQSDKVIGTPPVYLDDLLAQAAYDGIVHLPEGWEIPADCNMPINKRMYRRKP